jgi:exosortase/archaeosortase family protein
MAANSPVPAGPLIRTFASLGLVFALLRTAQSVDVMSGVTKPLVVALLKLSGLHALDAGSYLEVAHLRVPWTGDCAGLNALAVLLALTLWTNRTEPITMRLALKVAVAVPLAFLANIGRILTLIGYRLLFFPAVESPQLHYFIGFLWLLPFVGFFLPRAGAGAGPRWPGVLQMAAALGLVAPLATGPGGVLVTVCVLLVLALSRFSVPRSVTDYCLAGAWVVAAPLIAVSRMESLWLPWLLACPWLLSRPAGWFLVMPWVLLGTIPLAASHGVLKWLVITAAAGAAWNWLVRPSGPPAPERPPLRLPSIGAGALASLLVLPFLATSAVGRWAARELPPPGAMSRLVEARGHEVRLIGQSRDLSMVWYEPSGDGRHHTLGVCMGYRGVRLEPTGHLAVQTDGRHWMREYFLVGQELIPSYRLYLRRTLRPFAPAGVHVIVVGPKDATTAENFAIEAESLARRLQGLRNGA